MTEHPKPWWLDEYNHIIDAGGRMVNVWEDAQAAKIKAVIDQRFELQLQLNALLRYPSSMPLQKEEEDAMDSTSV